MAMTAPPLAGTLSEPVMSNRRPRALKTTFAKPMTGRYTGSRSRAGMPNGSALAELLRGGGPRGGRHGGGDAHGGVGLTAGPGAGAVGGHRWPGGAGGGGGR